jgi:hypothetical protein
MASFDLGEPRVIPKGLIKVGDKTTIEFVSVSPGATSGFSFHIIKHEDDRAYNIKWIYLGLDYYIHNFDLDGDSLTLVLLDTSDRYYYRRHNHYRSDTIRTNISHAGYEISNYNK